jgi:hypothetical protein
VKRACFLGAGPAKVSNLRLELLPRSKPAIGKAPRRATSDFSMQ